MAEDKNMTGEIKPHHTRVIVWDVPSTVECSEKFRVKLGVKCSAECQPNGWTVEVHDHNGKEWVTATLHSEAWPGTSALYHTEVELGAPDTEGLYTWSAKAPGDGLGVPHAESIAPFGVRVVPTPECLLTVVAIDMQSQIPVKGAKVVAHPYKTSTDEHGVAEIRLPKGDYRLFVSGKKYFPFRSECDIKADVTIRAELSLDRELSDADIWS